MSGKKFWMSAFIFIAMPMCVLAQTESQSSAINSDPYENYNRHMYTIDDTLDRAILKPVATLYQTVTPSFLRTGVTNFFDNIGEVPTVFNDVLQGNGHNTVKDTGRFLVNSTAGVGGLFDIASRFGMEKNYQDFGLTMAKWGYTSSNYLVLPVLGPSTVRDTIAVPVNFASAGNIFIYNFYPFVDDTTGYILTGTNFANQRANLLRFDNVRAQAYDPYVAVRDAYMQRRTHQIAATRADASVTATYGQQNGDNSLRPY